MYIGAGRDVQSRLAQWFTRPLCPGDLSLILTEIDSIGERVLYHQSPFC